MTDEYPFSAEAPQPTDKEIAAMLLRLVQLLDVDSADGRAGAMALLRDIRDRAPETIDNIHAGLTLARLGLTSEGTAH